MIGKNEKEIRRDEPQGTLFGGHYDEGGTYRHRRPQGMNDWLLFFTLEGEGYLRTPEGERRCGPGSVGLLRPGIPHEYGTAAGMRWHFYWVHFQKLPEIDYLPNDETIVASFPEGNLFERVRHAFLNILSDSRERTGFWHTLCENSLREIILLSAQQLEQRLDPRIELALRHLSRRMSSPLRIEELAGEVGLSVSRLSHLFKQETGESVVEHLNRLRLGQAALLMEHMGRTATEAALDVGFNNYNHFAALFRRAYGVSPRSYKKGKAAPPEQPFPR
ncbi:helix-turn-helix domain-containing protein [Paenibacillus arenilitoris]|uniref:Helix-turn-helix domain-containing protein n=1 Tax=Paenibacillus arenilitoris TaxID=2772299 RepID=A0A927CK92_9BACL|nr:helix-turn-helix domain-containing protein [Paenibacillus arenilitoris]MBD2867431.1 helix-turn-helix domain-containing protein [Paenibacillus arenilitoris]